MGRLVKNLGLYLILIVLVVSLVNVFLSPVQGPREIQEVSYSDFLSSVDSGKISSVTILENSVRGKFTDGREFVSYVVGVGDLANEVARKGVNVEVEPRDSVVGRHALLPHPSSHRGKVFFPQYAGRWAKLNSPE